MHTQNPKTHLGDIVRPSDYVPVTSKKKSRSDWGGGAAGLSEILRGGGPLPVIKINWVIIPVSRARARWFQNMFYFHPYLGEDEPNLTNIFQRGWFNHQLEVNWVIIPP